MKIFVLLQKEGIEQFSRRSLNTEMWERFSQMLFYHAGSFSDPAAIAGLKTRLQQIEPESGIPENRIFYLSIPPSGIGPCVDQLDRAGLIPPVDEKGPFSRIIVEKPIGHDLRSAQEINESVARVTDESQVYRIDHYLGKETVQSILVSRFANSIFEPLWNHKHIDHVQITVAEEVGVGTRAGYYEEAGAMRDMVQNHILQVLCLTAMEPPWAVTADVIRDHKMEVLNCLRPIRGEDVAKNVVRAQYGAGLVDGDQVPGYRREDGVKSDSITETYTAIKVHIDNWRWSGVPFYLRTGKRLPTRASEIVVQFREVPPILFNMGDQAPLEPNLLMIRIQPDEGMSMRISTKSPGSKVKVHPVQLDFDYGSTFDEQSPEAYERLLLDVMSGDANSLHAA